MDLPEFMSLLKKYRRHLTFQQFNIPGGQVETGYIDAAFKGLKKSPRRGVALR